MNIEFPLFMQEYINNNENLEKFIGYENTIMLIELIFNFAEQKQIPIHYNEETTQHLVSIISHYGYELLEERAMKHDSRNLVDVISLVELNKHLLSKVITFVKKHPNELHRFKYYIAQERQEQLIKERSLLEVERKQENATNETQRLMELQQKINELSKKYPNNPLSSLVIESNANPGQKFVIKSIDEDEEEQKEEKPSHEKLDYYYEFIETIYYEMKGIAEKHSTSMTESLLKDIDAIIEKIEPLIISDEKSNLDTH